MGYQLFAAECTNNQVMKIFCLCNYIALNILFFILFLKYHSILKRSGVPLASHSTANSVPTICTKLRINRIDYFLINYITAQVMYTQLSGKVFGMQIGEPHTNLEHQKLFFFFCFNLIIGNNACKYICIQVILFQNYLLTPVNIFAKINCIIAN